jgi:hypothetical protein
MTYTAPAPHCEPQAPPQQLLVRPGGRAVPNLLYAVCRVCWTLNSAQQAARRKRMSARQQQSGIDLRLRA